MASTILLFCVVVFFEIASGTSVHTSAGSEGQDSPSGIDVKTPSQYGSVTSTVPITKSRHGTSKGEALSKYLSPEKVDADGHSIPSLVDLLGASYIAEVTIGAETVPLLIDTGSSDLWVAPSSFKCLDADGNAVDQSECGFPSFVDDSFSGGAAPDEYLSIFYANKQYAYGPYGFEPVALGGITVPNQQIAMLSEGHIKVSSGDFAGILGLGYPGMVAGRKGDTPKHYVNNTDPMIMYDTWLFNAVKQNLTQPVFSMALDMDGGGLLGIGGVVDVPRKGDFAVSQILKVSLLDRSCKN